MKRSKNSVVRVAASDARQKEFYLSVKDLSTSEVKARQEFVTQQAIVNNRKIDNLTAALKDAKVEAKLLSEKLMVLIDLVHSRR